MTKKTKTQNKPIWCLDTNVLIRYCCPDDQYFTEYGDNGQMKIEYWLDELMNQSRFYMTRQSYHELYERDIESKPRNDERFSHLQEYAQAANYPYDRVSKHPDIEYLEKQADVQIQKLYHDIENSSKLASKKKQWFKKKGYIQMPDLTDDKKVLRHAYLAHKINPNWKVNLLSYDSDLTTWDKEIYHTLDVTIVDGYKFRFEEY